MKSTGSILCFGEIVWDCLPEGLFLGGAPLNVAYHLKKLGHSAYPVSRIGKDFLGEETARRLKASGLPLDLVQIDANHRTGAVIVSLNEEGNASYSILEPASWDFIEPEAKLREAAGSASALVYGTLSTRSQANAEVLRELIATIPFSVCDVNLRKPYDDPENAIHWASKASVVKLNDEELDQLAPCEKSDSLEKKAAELAKLLGVETLVVTRGGEGALVLHNGVVHSAQSPKVDVADTVGAGDAFTAAFISEFIQSGSAEEALKKAIQIGGYVASQRGAQPRYEPEDILS
jgi:fructokinase